MNYLKSIFSLFAIALIASCGSNNQSSESKNDNGSVSLPYSVRMADSEMQRMPDPRLIDFRPKPKWEYTNGLLCLSILRVYQNTGDEKYLQYGKYYADSMITDNGEILTYKLTDYNIDRINPGRLIIELNKIESKDKYLAAIQTLRQQMREHPRTSEGGFWHKKRYPSQMWLDGLYMGSPFLSQYASEFDEPTLFDDVANQFHLIDIHLYDSVKGLYYHGWDESREQKWADPETGLSPHFWGRAQGWFSMAIVDVLDFMPMDHPKRPELIQIANKVAAGIKKYQDPVSGVWYQVLDLGGKEGNYLEASCSSMFTYFLLKAVQNGYIDDSYNEVAIKGYKGILENFIKENEDGTISLTNVCAVAGLGGDPYRDASYEYYIGEPQRDNDPKGVGPFIMASILMEKMNAAK